MSRPHLRLRLPWTDKAARLALLEETHRKMEAAKPSVSAPSGTTITENLVQASADVLNGKDESAFDRDIDINAAYAGFAKADRAREAELTKSPRVVFDAEADSTAKPSNPKDLIGSDKLPYHLWPNTASVMGALGLLEGMLKYGRSNWRDAGVRFTIYYDAAQRHMDKLKAGEDIDEDSGLPHECHILACWAIIVDAKASGKFIDDRDFNGAGFLTLLKRMTPHVKRIKNKYQDRNAKHWTIADNPKE